MFKLDLRYHDGGLQSLNDVKDTAQIYSPRPGSLLFRLLVKNLLLLFFFYALFWVVVEVVKPLLLELSLRFFLVSNFVRAFPYGKHGTLF